MKRIGAIILVLIVTLICGCACDVSNEIFQDDSTNYKTNATTEIEELENRIQELESQVEVYEGKSVEEDNDEYIDNKYKYLVYNDYFEGFEDDVYALFKHENIDDIDDYSISLWRLNPSDSSIMIYEGKGYSFDFRVSNDNSMIAIKNSEKLMAYSSDGELLYELLFEELCAGLITITLEQWDDSSDTFWLNVTDSSNIKRFISIDIKTWKVQDYQIDFLESDDYELNPNTGWIAASDYPFLLELYHLDYYIESGATTTLYLYNLRTQEKIIVDTGETNLFKPEWDGDQVIYYYNDERVYHYELLLD